MTTRHMHFIGIGGIGMSGLATLVLQNKIASVSGSDLRKSYTTEQLQSLGAHVLQGHAAENIPASCASVVVSSDIAQDNPELHEARVRGLPILHRSDLLAELMQDKKAIAITGTHGKTTTTALMTHVLVEAKKHPSYAIGGIALNFGTNAGCGSGQFFVAEADESDGTFTKYAYHAAIMTNIDSDHLAHFGSKEKLEEAFLQFAAKSTHPERLFYCGDDETFQRMKIAGTSYGFSEGNDVRILRVEYRENATVFDLTFLGKKYKGIELRLLGAHNVLNAAAVFGLCLTLKISEEVIRSAFATFLGVKRRLEQKKSGKSCVVIDDYAHHPTEIRATLRAVRQRFSDRRIIAIFQPHRPSRMRHCLEECRGAFADADMVVITDLYLSSEKEDNRVTTKDIVEIIVKSHDVPSTYVSHETLVPYLTKTVRPHDVVLFLGAGDITKDSDTFANYTEKNSLKKLKVGVVYGGMNSENKISRVSANAIWSSLDKDLYDAVAFEIDQSGRWRITDGIAREEHSVESDCAIPSDVFEALSSCEVMIPVLHGPYGEDGTIQGFFETLHLPYVGCTTTACSVSMDKAISKQVVEQVGVPVVPYVVIDRQEWKEQKKGFLSSIQKQLRPPFFVKPVHLGSSIGVEKIDRVDAIEAAIERALICDNKILVEQGLTVREIEFAVLGNDVIKVPPPGEILADGKFYDYAAKYSSSSISATPKASVSAREISEWGEYVRKAYRALGCTGLARIDSFVDDDGNWYFNEVNPFPGFTKISLYPAIWGAQGVSYSSLIDELIVLALSRFRQSRRTAMCACALGRQMEGVCAV
jgi:UDP-N-acetylmuramate--alanine ligase